MSLTLPAANMFGVKIGLATRPSIAMTVPKFTLVFLGSLGEIGGPED